MTQIFEYKTAMPRRKYTRSDATYDVLRNHVGAVSKEYPCDDSYIYAIKNGDANDPFPPFRHLFQSAARAGAPAEIYLHELNGILARSLPNDVQGDIVKRLSDKITSDSNSTSEILEAVDDREIDKAECLRILAALEVSRDINRGIETLIERRLAELAEKGLKAVVG